MPIVIRVASTDESARPVEYSNEQELENLLADHPELLEDDSEGEEDGDTGGIQFVARQLVLPDAGTLDLLFISSDGLPVAVEVKLARNGAARREVVAQAIDYLSSLTSRTVDELDESVGGSLRKKVEEMASDELPFESLWRSIGTNLRAGKARLVVALDDASPDLERIFRFLTGSSSLDAQLLTVQKYKSTKSGTGTIYVSRTRVGSASGPEPQRERPKPLPELVAVFDAYNKIAPQNAPATGTAYNYRPVKIGNWPKHLRYQFSQHGEEISLKLYVPLDRPPAVLGALQGFQGKILSHGQVNLDWEPNYRDKYHGARLVATFRRTAPPQTIAEAMRELISLTQARVDEAVNSERQPTAATAVGT